MGNEDPESVEQLDLSHALSLAAVGYSQAYLPSLARLNALRVLDVRDCTGLGNHHVRDISKLLQLRYLNISLTKITQLPKEIGDLECLEMLDASKSGLHGLPDSVTRLKRLARLFVPEETRLPDGIGNMESLQELGHNINMYVESMKFLEGLGRLTNLKRLRICWDTNKHDRASSMGEMLVSSLRKLDKLRSLRIMLYLREEDGVVGHPSFPALSSIRKITLCRGQLSWIATWLASVTNLEKLFIKGTEMEQRDVEVLGSMPKLLELRAESNCTEGCTITVGVGGGFQRLRMLVFNVYGTELMLEPGAMPNLKELYLGVRLRNYNNKHGAGCGFNGFGIDHLSDLAWLHVGIDCRHGKASDLEAAKGVFKSMANAHPNRPTLEMYISFTDMLQIE